MATSDEAPARRSPVRAGPRIVTQQGRGVSQTAALDVLPTGYGQLIDRVHAAVDAVDE